MSETLNESVSSSYQADCELELEVTDKQLVKARIIEIKTTTLSCVMTIQLPSCPELEILKLYDRRTAKQLRRDEDAEPWDITIENRYREFLKTGKQTALFESWHEDSRDGLWWGIHEDQDEWSQEILETYLQFWFQKIYTAETRANDRMRAIQRVHVPKLYAKVTLCEPRDTSTPHSSTGDVYLDCPGIILDYVPGFPLTDMADNLPQTLWQQICDEAIEIVLKIGDLGICNRDMNTRNFVIAPALDNAVPKPFMIDFGLCIFRMSDDEEQYKHWQTGLDDDEFGKFQADEDEEGAIGVMMQKFLKGRYKYVLSQKALYLLDRFKREDPTDILDDPLLP